MMDLNKVCGMQGKVAMVTGAASGIGNGVSRFFADAGVKVVMLDINETLGKEKAKEIVDAGNEAEFLKCDVTLMDDCRNAADFTAKKYGKIDILVNCAGVARRKDVVDLTEAEWDLSIDVMLKSIYLMCHNVIPYMKKQGGGKIVSIGSGWSLKGGENATAYCAAKAGVWNLTRAMAIDHGADNININCVCPGDIDTPMLKSECEQLGDVYDDEYKKDVASDRPMAHIGEPEDVAKCVFFFASDMSPWVTGSSLVVDGGGMA